MINNLYLKKRYLLDTILNLRLYFKCRFCNSGLRKQKIFLGKKFFSFISSSQIFVLGSLFCQIANLEKQAVARC
jgi:hypothetical protein